MRKLVVDGICTQLVDPHRIAVPLAAKCASKYRWPQPKNVWRITVVEAENLVNADAVRNQLKWGASSRWPLFLYRPMWNIEQMIIGKTHPTLTLFAI